MKEIRIEIPENCEIDEEKSTFKKIVFKKKIKEIEVSGGHYWVSAIGHIIHGSSCKARQYFGIEFATEKEAEKAADEMRRLNRLRKHMWDLQEKLDPDWKPDWDDDSQNKYIISYNSYSKRFTHTHALLTNYFVPVCSGVVAKQLVEDLNNGIRKL